MCCTASTRSAKKRSKDYYFDGENYHMEGYGEELKPRRRHAEMFWIHLRHRIDIIVQFLMCNADSIMTTMTWLGLISQLIRSALILMP
jgi:hypothetical protein